MASLVNGTPVLGPSLGETSRVGILAGGVWLVANVNPGGIAPTYFNSLYADAACLTPAFLPLDSNPAPFFRSLQSVTPSDATGYFAGNPPAMQTFQGMSDLGQPGTCAPTAGTGWDQPMLAGPQQTFDLSAFPAPFAIKQ